MTKRKGLDRDLIKYIAIFAMLLDHIAWGFLKFSSPTAQIFHIIGRITAPTMCFFLAEGYIHTRNVKKYALRLLIFAIISQVPWVLFHSYRWYEPDFSMIYTLLICLISIICLDKISNKFLRIVAVFLCLIAASFGDWSVFAVFYAIGFYLFRDKAAKKYISFSVVSVLYFLYVFVSNMSVTTVFNSFISSLFTLGTFLAIPLLISYNGEKGKWNGSKWVFYIFYPLHMMILWFLKDYIFGG